MENEISAAGPAPERAPAAEAAAFVPVGFWVRGGAMLIDAALSMLVSVPLGLALRLGAGVPQLLVTAVQFVLSVAYHTAFVAQWGATVGKMAAGIEIVRPDGSRLSYPRALGRFFAQYVSLFVLGIGYIMAAFTPEKCALHDYIVDSRVVYKPGVGEGRQAAMAALGALTFVGPFVVGVLLAVAIGSGSSKLLGAGGPFANFSRLIQRSSDGADQGNLGALRAGLMIYYGDKDGAYPADLHELIPKYVQTIPVLKLQGRADTSDVEYYEDDVCGGPKNDQLDATKLRNTGKWGYVRPKPGKEPGKACVGTLFIDSSDADAKGKAWNTY